MLTVSSIAENGTAINGYYVTLYENGKVIATGYTPVSFTLTNNQAYQVESHNYGSYAFDYWADTGNATQLRSISIDKNTTLLAVYKPTGGSTPPSGDSYISINTMLSNGTQISGYYTTLWQNNKEVASGFSPYTFTVACCNTYQVEVSDYNLYMFNHWGDGNTTRLQTVIPTNQGTVVMTAVYQAGITISQQAAVFEPGYSRNIPMVVTNQLRYSVNLTSINSLTTTSSDVRASLASSLPLSIPSGGSSVFNLNVSVSNSVPFGQYNITGVAELDSVPSFAVSFIQSVGIAVRYLNATVVTMKSNNEFENSMSATNQTEVNQGLAIDSNFTLTSALSPEKNVANASGYNNKGEFASIQATPSILLNQTTSSIHFLILNESWTAGTLHGNQMIKTSGNNYTLELQETFSQYNISITASFGACGCAHFALEWGSDILSDLHIGDTIQIANVTNLQEFFQGLYLAVNSLSNYYSSSSNSTLRTLGQRYGEVLTAINYTIENIPSSLKNLLVRFGEGTITDNFWVCWGCLEGAGFLVVVAIYFVLAIICGVFLPLCIFIIVVLLWFPPLTRLIYSLAIQAYCQAIGLC